MVCVLGNRFTRERMHMSNAILGCQLTYPGFGATKFLNYVRRCVWKINLWSPCGPSFGLSSYLLDMPYTQRINTL